jgi:hypothetical protein
MNRQKTAHSCQVYLPWPPSWGRQRDVQIIVLSDDDIVRLDGVHPIAKYALDWVRQV